MTEGSIHAPLPPPPPVADGYVVEEMIGRGGGGVVWRAVQEGTLREVALKFLAPWQAHGLAGLRFAREAEIAASLEHENVVRVHDSGESVSGPWLAMELVAGPTADRWVAENKPSLRMRLELFRGICAGVRHAHQRRVIHRDLKPSNVLVAPGGVPKVSDFGLAAREEGSSLDVTLTREGEVFGSLAWMAPEQAEGRGPEVDALSDIYALGGVLYSLVSGKPPVETSLPAAVQLAAVKSGAHLLLREVCPGTPRDVEAIVEKCMSPPKAQRYQSSAELEEDVARWLRGDPVRARQAAPLYWLSKKLRRHWVAAAAVVTLLFSSGGLVWGYWQGRARLEEEKRAALRREADQKSRTLHDAQELVIQLLVEMRPKLEDAGHPEWISEAERRLAAFPWDLGGTGKGAWDPRRFQGRAALVQGDILAGKGQHGPALQAYHEAVLQLNSLVEEQPQVRFFREDLIRARIGESSAMVKLGFDKEARTSAGAALKLIDQLPGETLPASLNESLVDAACLLTSAARSSAETAGEALDTVLRVEQRLPGGEEPALLALDQAVWRSRIARAAASLAAVSELTEVGRAAASRAVGYARRAVHLDPGSPRTARYFAEGMAVGAEFLNAAGDVDAAAAVLQEATAHLISRRKRAAASSLESGSAGVAQAWENTARIMAYYFQYRRAVEANEQALALWRMTRNRNPVPLSRLLLRNAEYSAGENAAGETERYAALTVKHGEHCVTAGTWRAPVGLDTLEASLILLELGAPDRGGKAMTWKDCALTALRKLAEVKVRLNESEEKRRAELEKRLALFGCTLADAPLAAEVQTGVTDSAGNPTGNVPTGHDADSDQDADADAGEKVEAAD